MTLRQSILKNLAASTRYTVLESSMIDFARMTADREPLAQEVVAELVEMEQRGEVVRGRMGAQRIWKLTAKGKRAADSELSTQFQSAPRDRSRGDNSPFSVKCTAKMFQSAPRDRSRGDHFMKNYLFDRLVSIRAP